MPRPATRRRRCSDPHRPRDGLHQRRRRRLGARRRARRASGCAPSARPAARGGRAGRGNRRPAISTPRPWSASQPGDPPAPTLALVAAVALHEVGRGLRARGADQMAERPAVRRRQARRHPARAPGRCGDRRLRRQSRAAIPTCLDRPATSLAALRGGARAGALPRRLARRLRALARALADRRASRRSAPPGSPPPIRSARRSSRPRAKACSRASTKPARCGCAWRTARSGSYMRATFSCCEAAMIGWAIRADGFRPGRAPVACAAPRRSAIGNACAAPRHHHPRRLGHRPCPRGQATPMPCSARSTPRPRTIFRGSRPIC